jgi:hypothetical protein
MPYRLKRKPGTNLWWVVTDASGRHLSEKPMPLERAKKQLIAVNIALHIAKSNLG